MRGLLLALTVLVFIGCTNESKEQIDTNNQKNEPTDSEIKLNTEKRKYIDQLTQIENQFIKIRKVINIIQKHINTKEDILTTVDFFMSAIRNLKTHNDFSELKGTIPVTKPFDCSELPFSITHEIKAETTSFNFNISPCNNPEQEQTLIRFDINSNTQTLTNYFNSQSLKNIFKVSTLTSETLPHDILTSTPTDTTENSCKSQYSNFEMVSLSCSQFNISLLEIYGKKIELNSFLYDPKKLNTYSGVVTVINEDGTKDKFNFTQDKFGRSQFDQINPITLQPQTIVK